MQEPSRIGNGTDRPTAHLHNAQEFKIRRPNCDFLDKSDYMGSSDTIRNNTGNGGALAVALLPSPTDVRRSP